MAMCSNPAGSHPLELEVPDDVWFAHLYDCDPDTWRNVERRRLMASTQTMVRELRGAAGRLESDGGGPAARLHAVAVMRIVAASLEAKV